MSSSRTPKLATLGITPQALFDSLAKQNNVHSRRYRRDFRAARAAACYRCTDGVKAVAETPVESNGRVFRLGDIATVTHGYVDPPTFTVRQEGKARARHRRRDGPRAPTSSNSARTSRRRPPPNS